MHNVSLLKQLSIKPRNFKQWVGGIPREISKHVCIGLK